MNHTTPRTRSSVRRLGAALALLALLLSPLRAEELSITIQCSPATVVLHAVRSGDWFTVHADIPYRLVEPQSVELVAPKGVLPEEPDIGAHTALTGNGNDPVAPPCARG